MHKNNLAKNEDTSAVLVSQFSSAEGWATNQQPLPSRKQSEWPCTDHFLLYLSFLFVNEAHAEEGLLLEMLFFFWMFMNFIQLF